MEASVSATPVIANSGKISPQLRPARLQSLDLFRGITIAAMILVNNAGDEPSAHWPLRHAEWNGWTPTDLVFPFFLFIVGVAMAFSFRFRLDCGESRSRLLKHVLWRGILLFAIGMFLNGFPSHYQLAHWRIYGVLQRIAICYVVTAILELWTSWRAQLSVALACLVGYWIVMRYIPVPGFGIPTHNMPLLDPDRNIAAWLDRRLLTGHLYEVTRDPEGIISTIPAFATCLLGLLTGKWLKTDRTSEVKAFTLAVAGIAAVVIGRIAAIWFPINKKLWTSSYVMFTAGLAMAALALLYWVVDAKRLGGRWTRPIFVFGTNAIAAYFFAEVVAHMLYRISFQGTSLQEYIYSRVFAPVASAPNASLLYAIAFVTVCWVAMSVLYRKRIFIKI